MNIPNIPIKRHYQVKKQDPTLCCLQQFHFKYKDSNRLKVNGGIKIHHDNKNQRKVVTVSILDNEDFIIRKSI